MSLSINYIDSDILVDKSFYGIEFNGNVLQQNLVHTNKILAWCMIKNKHLLFNQMCCNARYTKNGSD